MKTFTIIYITVAILLSALQPMVIASSALTDDGQLPYLSLYEFLTEMEIDLEEYITLMNEISKSGVYPHFLDENTSRYEAYQREHPEIPYEQILSFINIGMDYGFYNNITLAPDLYEVSVLVNKNFNLPSQWEPENMEFVSRGRTMNPEAAEHFDLMREAITNEGFEVHVISAYRSRGRQARIFSDEMELRGRAAAERSVARAGHSEHQTGLVVDILHRSYGSLRYANFQETELFRWLTQNAHEYGFILRYPDEYQEYHGYIFEPWHWRYVGIEIATAMFNEKIVLYEDFYGRYIVSDVLHNAKELITQHREYLAEVAAQEAADAQEAERLALLEEESRQSTNTQSRQMILGPSTDGNAISASLDSEAINPVHYRAYITILTLIALYILSTFIFIVIPKIKEKRGA